MKRIPVLLLLTAVLPVASCLKSDPFKLPYAGFTPVTRNDGWTVSTPETENMDRDLLDKAYRLVYRDDRYWMARSLLVIRNGRLVAEAYPHDPDDIDRIANIQSMTKTFTAILAGMALEKELLDSLDATFFSIYPEHFEGSSGKKDITLRHALTMTTGILFDNDVNTLQLYRNEGSSVEYVLSLQQEYAPGLVFRYHDGAPHLVSAAVQKRFGRPLASFADDFLFTPLGITEWKWEASPDGVTFGAFSLFLKPRDLARFGQLLLQDGTWDGAQIVDSSWVAEATTVHVNGSSLGAPYGYFVWIYPALGGYAADGHGGQHVMAIPGKQLVIVYTAWGYTSGDFFDDFNEVASLISQACH